MTQKFPFNHFLKLDGLNESTALTQGEVSPVVIEKTLFAFSVLNLLHGDLAVRFYFVLLILAH
jgi:hypothetical protein